MTAILTTALLVVSVLIVVGQGNNANATTTAQAGVARDASPVTAGSPGGAAKPDSAQPDSKQPPYTTILPGHGKAAGGLKTQVDVVRVSQGKIEPVKPESARPAIKSGPAVELPPVCPKKPDGELYANRFAMCQYWTGEQTIIIDVTDNGVVVQSTRLEVNYTLEMFAEMAAASREWLVGVIFTPTELTGGVPGEVTVSAVAGLTCSLTSCTVKGGPGNGDLGAVEQDVPLEAEYQVSNTSSSAVLDLNNALPLGLQVSGGGAECVSNCGVQRVFSFADGSAPVIRCDSQGRSPAPLAACVVWVAKGTWVVTNADYPSMDLVVKHMAIATGRLAGYNGLPGLPGRTTALTYAGLNSATATANNRDACEDAPRPPGTPAAYNTCDEYPFASTFQGAASGGPYSVCWVPRLANNSQGGAFGAFLALYRMAIGDKFYVEATYTGKTAGCSDNLGGGGPVTTDSQLDNMFGSYGNNATCADWSGGDATNSVVLPDGERAWFFSDTYLNSPAARKGLWFTSVIHNSVVIQDSGGIARTITGGNTCKETDLSLPFLDRYAVTPATAPDGGFYWTGDQMLVGSQVIKFYYYGHSSTLPNGGSTFAIDYPAVASIPASSLEHDSVATINPVPFSCGTGNIIWGTALLNWDGYVYIYGWRSTGIGSGGTYLARASAANLAVSKAGQAPAWQVYDGMSGQNPVWGSCASTPAALAINGTTGFSVDAVNGSLWLVQFDYTHGQANAAGAIGAHPSATPWGFGNNTVALYTPPTGVVEYPYFYQDYEARIQPGLGAAGQVVISYNVNTSAVDTGCVSANAHDAAIYRPRFIDVPVSDFKPGEARAAPGTTSAASQPVTPAVQTAVQDTPGTGIDGSADWFDKPLGAACPAISAPRSAPSLSSASFGGILEATWPNMGTDVWYYGWLCDKTEHSCSTEGTSGDWVPAWPTNMGNLWSTVPDALIDPIAATSTATHSTGGDTFVFYVRSFGAGNVNGGGNSPEVTVKVSVLPSTRPVSPGAFLTRYSKSVIPNDSVLRPSGRWLRTAGQRVTFAS
ncbi:MAG TPA: NucA/NucB deoxyribonuclease domain-containing protein [Trebonia sp.]